MKLKEYKLRVVSADKASLCILFNKFNIYIAVSYQDLQTISENIRLTSHNTVTHARHHWNNNKNNKKRHRPNQDDLWLFKQMRKYKKMLKISHFFYWILLKNIKFKCMENIKMWLKVKKYQFTVKRQRLESLSFKEKQWENAITNI